METARLPYTQRNVLATCVLLLVAAGYWLQLWGAEADMAAHRARGDYGELAFLSLIPPLFLLLYTGIAGLLVGEQALRRGSEPVSGGRLLLGLLPTGLWLLPELVRWLAVVFSNPH